MSLLQELKSISEAIGVTALTGVFSSSPPDVYCVLTPLADSFELFADNTPEQDIEEVRISIFDKGNYKLIKKAFERALLSADITVTGRRYIGHEDDTGYHHYAIDTAKNYELEESEGV